MVPIPTVVHHLLCLSAIHIVIPWLLWDSAGPANCNTTAAAKWQLWLYTNCIHARSEVFTSVLMRIHIFWDVTVSKAADAGQWRCYIPSKYHPATHFHIPEARIFNLHLLLCLCRTNSRNPSKTKTNAALNSSLCTPLANDTTQTNHCLKIQVFWDTHIGTSLTTWISITSTKRTLNLTSPPLCAWTAQFVTHHWTSLTI